MKYNRAMTIEVAKGPVLQNRPQRHIRLKDAIVAIACVWLLWLLFDAALLGNSSGKREWGGFPVAARADLDRFLNDAGFAPYSLASSSTTGQKEEWFRGSYQGSRPFLVKICTQDASPYGIYVEINYDYKGFKRNVEESSNKAEKFANMLCEWLTEQRMGSINARYKTSAEPKPTVPAL